MECITKSDIIKRKKKKKLSKGTTREAGGKKMEKKKKRSCSSDCNETELKITAPTEVRPRLLPISYTWML